MSSISSTISSTCYQSNFERMLHSLTPRFPSRSVPENHVEALNKIWNPVGNPITQYYILGDLWESLEKWSACGAGTRVEICDNEDLMQYFVPHLSAIQIFTLKSPGNLKIREDIDTLIDVEDELWSDESDGEKSTGSATSNVWDNTSGDSNIDSDDWLPMKKNLKNLYLEYCETCSPYVREPIYDKVLHLAKDYPGLMTLRSTDLSPASWMAISWYPIYHIPAQESMVDMSSAFLTFHTLSSLFQDGNDDEDTFNGGRQSISLPPFGVAAYKFKGDIWFDHGDSDCAMYQILNHAADSWLKQLNFDHHDFKFFTLKATHVCNDACSCQSSGEYCGSFY